MNDHEDFPSSTPSEGTGTEISEEIQVLINQFEKQKGDRISLILPSEEENIEDIKIYEEDRVNKQLLSSVNGLRNWSSDPYNCNEQEYGKALEILTKNALEKILGNSLNIRYSPAELDYIPNYNQNLSSQNYPSIDLILGLQEKKGFRPILFVNTSLSKDEKPLVHDLFKTPIATIKGKDYLNRAEDIILQNFATTSDVENFLNSTDQFYGKRMVDKILQDLITIKNENFEEIHKRSTLRENITTVENLLLNYTSR